MKRPLKPGVRGAAQFVRRVDGSPIARLRLDRWWDESLALDLTHGRPADARYRPLVVIGMNPSDADGESDDPTAAKVCTYARREGANGAVIVNVTPEITKDPRQLGRRMPYGCDARHWEMVDGALCENGVAFVAAWGKRPIAIDRGTWANRLGVLREIVRDVGRELVCFGTNDDGSPKHPGRLANSTPLVPYRWNG